MSRGTLHFRLKALASAGLLRGLAWYLSPRRKIERRRKRSDASAFDAAGYDTGTIAFLDAMTIADRDALADANPYDATPTYVFEEALALLDIAATDATFVGLGSGKGRTLLLAARHPFLRIVGVEFAEELQSTARTNLARHAVLHGPDARIELHTGDAARFAFPDTPLVIFLYNPFGAETLSRVAARLRASWLAHPRPIRILYVNPQHGAEWVRAGFDRIGGAADNRFALYAPSAG